VIAAAKRGAVAVGIEYNPQLVALSRRTAAREGLSSQRALFIQGDIAAVFSSFSENAADVPGRWWNGTRVDLVDISDRSAPVIVRSFQIGGHLVGARMIDGVVYGVLWTGLIMPDDLWGLVWRDDIGLPDVPWDASEEEREHAAAIAREVLRPFVQDSVRRVGVERLLPIMRGPRPDGSLGSVRPLVGCSDVYRPPKVSSFACSASFSCRCSPPGT
jgi:hypothetical protein